MIVLYMLITSYKSSDFIQSGPASVSPLFTAKLTEVLRGSFQSFHTVTRILPQKKFLHYSSQFTIPIIPATHAKLHNFPFRLLKIIYLFVAHSAKRLDIHELAQLQSSVNSLILQLQKFILNNLKSTFLNKYFLCVWGKVEMNSTMGFPLTCHLQLISKSAEVNSQEVVHAFNLLTADVKQIMPVIFLPN
jgi:hypothetical protein